MWGPIPNSSAPTVISVVISLGNQGTVSPLRNKPLRKKVTTGQNERNVCVTQNLYACQKPYDIGCDRKIVGHSNPLFLHHTSSYNCCDGCSRHIKQAQLVECVAPSP